MSLLGLVQEPSVSHVPVAHIKVPAMLPVAECVFKVNGRYKELLCAINVPKANIAAQQIQVAVCHVPLEHILTKWE